MFAYQNVACIADIIRQAPYEYDEIHIYYNHFVNSISQKSKVLEIMSHRRFMEHFDSLSIHEVDEPEASYQRQYYYELYVASCLTRCLLPCNVTKRSLRTNITYERYGERLEECRRDSQATQS